ncbi:response regulator [Sulfurimonas sp.]
MILTPTLIVDDSLMIIKIIKKALLANTLDGFHFDEQNIYTATDGMEAFKVMGEGHSIKLIISDINMPNLNGDEFIEILQDTGKLQNLHVAFVTSSTNLFLSPSIKEHILGVIYKPFKYDCFIDQLRALQNKKMQKDIEHKHIRKLQSGPKEYIQKVCVNYIEELKLTVDIDNLTTLIDDIFGYDEIISNEYPEIVHSILSSYMFDIENPHAINNKKIFLTLKKLETKVEVSENRFNFIDDFKSQIQYVNSNELSLKEVLNELTNPTLDKISIAFVKAKNFPKLKIQLFAPHFDYIVKELTELDCYFMDDVLQKLILEQKEVDIFNKWLYDFLTKNELSSSVEAVAKSNSLKVEVIKRLKLAYQQSFQLSQHYCGQIEFYLWRRAKGSADITEYLKKSMPNTIPCSPRFLLHKKKISTKEHEVYLPFEKQNVLVLSNNLNLLNLFKDIVDPPFDKWNFFCFTKLSLLDAWIHANIPNKIIIDCSIKSSIYDNGIELLKLLIKNYPIFQELVSQHKVYIIANNNQLVKIHEYKNKYNFSIIQEPLVRKELNKTLLYD